MTEPKGPSRTGIRNNSGEIVGERWILTPEQVFTLLDALDLAAGLDLDLTPAATALYEKLTGEKPEGANK